MLRIVVDTNIWIRTLLGGQISLPVLVALQEDRFKMANYNVQLWGVQSLLNAL